MSKFTGGYIKLSIDDDYRWVLMVAGIVAFECIMMGFIIGGRKRRSYFSAEALANSEFAEEHKKEFKVDIPGGGYPDHGNGFYSRILSYEQWYKFQIDQRIHKNFLETVTIVTFNICLLGLFWSQGALICGIVQAVGRLIYAIGYNISPNGRFVGFLMIFLSLLVLYGANLYYICSCLNSLPDKTTVA